MGSDVPVLAVTPGEPSGIGPEILLKLSREHPEFRLLAVADLTLLRQAAERLGFDDSIIEWQPGKHIPVGQLACFPVKLASPAVFVFGCESRGLDAGIRERYAERLVRIPMLDDRVRSLNLSTTVGITLYAASLLRAR